MTRLWSIMRRALTAGTLTVLYVCVVPFAWVWERLTRRTRHTSTWHASAPPSPDTHERLF